MSKISNTYGMKFLKRFRGEESITQFSIKMGLSTPTYIQYERSGKRISLENLGMIRKKLGLSWSEYGRLIDQEIEESKIKK